MTHVDLIEKLMDYNRAPPAPSRPLPDAHLSDPPSDRAALVEGALAGALTRAGPHGSARAHGTCGVASRLP